MFLDSNVRVVHLTGWGRARVNAALEAMKYIALTVGGGLVLLLFGSVMNGGGLGVVWPIVVMIAVAVAFGVMQVVPMLRPAPEIAVGSDGVTIRYAGFGHPLHIRCPEIVAVDITRRKRLAGVPLLGPRQSGPPTATLLFHRDVETPRPTGVIRWTPLSYWTGGKPAKGLQFYAAPGEIRDAFDGRVPVRTIRDDEFRARAIDPAKDPQLVVKVTLAATCAVLFVLKYVFGWK
jgi:hypothetical protein